MFPVIVHGVTEQADVRCLRSMRGEWAELYYHLHEALKRGKHPQSTPCAVVIHGVNDVVCRGQVRFAFAAEAGPESLAEGGF